MKKLLLFLLTTLLPLMANAHDIAVKNADGVTIYYNYTNDSTELAVTYRGNYYDSYFNEYTGNVVIPEEVTYMNRNRKVTSIGYDAFYGCSSLTSITIPNSVTSIVKEAFSGCKGLTSITIPNSVTSIGNYAFFGCSGLTLVTIGESVMSIGSWAFEGCSGLTSVTIPNSVTSIGDEAFRACIALTSVTIPNSVTSIGGGAFQYCSSLTSVTIPNSVTSIGNKTFYNCYGLTSVIIGNGVTTIGNEAFYACKGLTSVTIGDGLTSIASNAFSSCYNIVSLSLNCKNVGSWFSGFSSIKEVILGDNVESISNDAFWSCSGLTSITIPDNVMSIGNSAFGDCSSLSSATIGNSVISIGDYAFNDCSSLTSITIPNSVTSIGDYAFDKCSNLISATIGNSVTSVGDYAFQDCSSLTSITIPNSVISIGSYAFCGCSNLTSATIGNSVTSIGDYAFGNCSSLKSVIIPNSVISIGSYVFTDCSKLASVTIGNGVTSIGSYVFLACSSLASITIPNNVLEIGPYAFYKCSSLVSAELHCKKIAKYCFDNLKSIKQLILGDELKEIGQGAFYGCTGLTSINLPNSINKIEDKAFYNCSNILRITVGTGKITWGNQVFYNVNPYKVIWFSSTNPIISGKVNINYQTYPKLNEMFEVDGIKYVPIDPSKRTCHAVDCIEDETVENLVIGKTVSYRGIDFTIEKCYGTFIGNQYIKKLEIDNEKGIGEYMCYYCEKLEDLTLSNTVTEIGLSAFQGCSSLQSVEIPSSIVLIDKFAFSECTSIKKVIVKDLAAWCKITFTTLGSNPLTLSHHLYSDENTEITDLIIPNSVTSIGSYAFASCLGLTSVTIPNSVTNIGDYIFYDCSNLKSATISDGIASIGEDAFFGCSGLTAVTIPENVISIGEYSFAHCTGLASIVVPNSVTSIGRNAFTGCTGLASINIGNSVSSIGDAAFKDCVNLSSVTMNSKTIKEWFSGNKTIKAVIIGDNAEKIANSAFSSCSNLKLLKIGNGIKTIGNNSFSGCSSLEACEIGSKLTNIGEKAFKGCSYLKKLICRAIVPPSCGTQALSDIDKWECTLSVPESATTAYQEANQWKDFYFINNDVTQTLTITYKLSYVVDGTEYKSYELEEGAEITPEPAPTKEGYTFSGWSDIPATMPAHDVTVTGTFAISTYKLTYLVDGEIYKSYDVKYGTTITPETKPTKEGYTFSGWSEIPATMPAHDVTVTGTFAINSYKLTYIVDGEVYKSYDIEYSATITPEAEPTKEGYTFSGWSEIPATMPAHDVTVTGTFSINSYKLTYVVDGVEYKSYDIEYGATITPEAEPTKEGYTFSGWSTIPETMPAHDVTITGTFIINKYKLTYIVDGVEYKSYDIEYGATITPEAEPTKEGYTFSGWSTIPTTMPAHDVTITGSFTKGAYKLTYMLDGVVYKTISYDYGDAITPEPSPTKEGYTFSGWSEIPETMPAHDVTVTGTFSINKYKLTYTVDGEVYKTYEMEYGATITPEAEPTKEGYTFSGWSEIPTTMPAHDVTVTGTFTLDTGIEQIMRNANGDVMIFTIDGKRVDNLKKGMNVIRMKDGTTRKVVVK